MAITILLVDDHTIVRDGLCALLEKDPQLIIVGSVSNGLEAIKQVRELKPDVVLMDISMPELNGIDATQQIRQESCTTQVVILSIHATTEHIYRAFRAGAIGYLLKESAGSEAINAVYAAFEGRRYLTQRIADTVLDSYLLQNSETFKKSPMERLSEREIEVLKMVVEGISSTEIAAKLSLSARTVETYRSRIMQKLDLHSLPALIRFAIENHLTNQA
jgi:DNA-binding NarL/FixJ family response regulator